jgi:hypothetical protein
MVVTPVIPTLGRLRQEDGEFKASTNILRPASKIKTRTKNKTMKK